MTEHSIPVLTDQIPALAERKADSHPAAVYLASLAPGSRRAMADALETIAEIASERRCTAETLPWHLLRHQHAAAIRAVLAERYKPATANKTLCALRGVLRECWRLGQITAEEYQRAADVKGIKAQTLPRGRALTCGELRALFQTCADDKTPAGRRDAALLAVLYGAGLRRSEAVALDLAHYAPETGALTIRSGKGRKDRIAYATNGAQLALEEWLAARGTEPGPLFLPITWYGKMEFRRMTTQAVYSALGKRAKEARVERFSPHDLRRTFVSDLLDAGADVSMVQQLAGHSNVGTTQRYDRRPEVAKRKAAENLIVPFVSNRAR
jgi:site-specific recombinase XerD